MYIGCARNLQEIENALLLATLCFRSETTDEAINVKRLLMSPGNSFAKQDVIVLIKPSGEICGTCFLIDRLFYRGKNQVQGTFLSSICIAEGSRGEGLSRLLMNAAIEECERRSSAFAILIARRAVDHFYNKFFFWGLSQYSSINIKLSDTGPLIENYSTAAVTEDDLEIINKLYEGSYRNLYGACVRSKQYWKYLIWKINEQSQQFSVFKRDGEIKGYAIFSGCNLHEFGTADDVSSLELLNEFGKKNSLKEVNLSGSQDHPVVRELQGLDFTITQRQCNYGGHMVRIICKDRLINSLREELQEELDCLGVKQWSEQYGEVRIEVNRGKIDLALTGPVNCYKSTCVLMGADYLSASNRFIVYKPRSFNVPLMDQG